MKNFTNTFRTAAYLAVFCLGVFVIGASAQATFIVTKIADTNDGTCNAADCSLREAVVAANANGGTADFITFSALFNTAQTISLTLAGIGDLGDLDLTGTDGVTITGPGARLLTINQTVVDQRVFDVNAGGIGTITGVTVGNTDDAGDGSDDDGACIRNEGTATFNSVQVIGCRANSDGGGIWNNATLTILNSLIVGNSTAGAADNGGGFYNSAGTATIANSTFTTNTVAGVGADGGAIRVETGTLNLTNVTISGNTANDTGGGISDNSTTNLRNTIVANNISTANTSEDVAGTITSQGDNLIEVITGSTGFGGTDITGVDPGLGALANNGGTTDTMTINVSSAAWNQGNNCVTTTCGAPNNPPALTTDQRGAGFVRLAFATVDIGAFELPLASAADATISGRVVTAQGRAISRATITVTDANGESKTVLSNTFGFFNVSELPTGQTYLVSVSARGYTFATPSYFVDLSDNVGDLNFVSTR
ncbi:MAG: choice-of-anchor Q domain-containing protein [Pyrinomonadaceae bacterium]